jgi:sodium/bile acid cotransporter 7
MLPWLARRWFLIGLAAGLGAAALRPDAVRPWTDLLPLRLVVAVSLLLASLGLEGRRLIHAVRRPGGVALGLLISFAVLPLAALAVRPALPGDDVAVGLLIMLSVPCTLSSAVLWTRQAGGDEAVALLIVVATNLLGCVVTPMWLTAAGPVAVRLDVPGMMRSLALVLVAPVAAGQLLRLLPGVAEFAARRRALIGVAARVLIASVLIAAAAEAASRAELLSVPLILMTLLACAGLHLGGLTLGFEGGRRLRLPRGDRIAAGIAGSQKTLPVALYLYGDYYRADYPLAVLPLLLYHLAQLLLDTVIADRLARDAPGGGPGAATGPPRR